MLKLIQRSSKFITIMIVQALYDFSRNKLQHKVSQRFLVNRGVPYDILIV